MIRRFSRAESLASGRHAINVVTVLTRPSVGYAKFFGRIPSAGFHKTSLAPVVVRWTRPILSSEVRANESRHHHPARASGRRAAGRAMAHVHLQRAGGRREPLQERLRPDRRAAQTPLRA